VTVVGTTARRVLLLASSTIAFPVGAAARNVTVPVDGLPSETLLGFKVTEETALETTRNSVSLTVVPPDDALMTTGVVDVTVAVLAVKVALVCPAGTVTLAGTVTRAVLALDSVTTVPPLGAGALKNTVPVVGLPPGTLPGNCTALSNANKVTSAFAVTPFKVAETRTFVVAVTGLVVTVNPALV